MTTPYPEEPLIENVSEGESEDARRVENTITPEFVEQNFARLREMVKEQEKKERMKEAADGVLRFATRIQEGTTSKHIEYEETPRQEIVGAYPQNRPTLRRTTSLAGDRRLDGPKDRRRRYSSGGKEALGGTLVRSGGWLP
jgi:hypothetical protein